MKFAVDTFACDGGKSGFGSYLSNLAANLPADGAAVPVLRAASLDGRENFASAVVVGEDGTALPGGYRLFFRHGVVFAAIPEGFQVIIR